MMVPTLAADLPSFFGLFGMLCLAVWPLFRSRVAMLSVQLAAVSGLSLHYALLGVTTAATVDGLGALQIALVLVLGTRSELRWIGYLLAIAMVASSVVTWQGTVSLLAATGMALIAIGRLQERAGPMRALVLAGGPFWLAHDLMVGSPVAVADAASLAFGLGRLAWERIKRRRPRRPRVPLAFPMHGVG
ncbi:MULTISPECIES: YgjV family protein [Rhodomicrobium]|uniref:YgjV family protein n=1 Tax=Rhodomicrobium TaxID=1068 RepID=UPI000B4BC514|nr:MULTISPECIES: YgjV family protein [Rhodomicrobium]